ncbi:UMP kinase [Candidatus Nitrososphaera sp. FF02]|uniref:UMP kinase n=1 Tax=Candidatus Nitrososphaera sp. FF02 TaxID=3398226 RepID=UPI0039E74CF0
MANKERIVIKLSGKVFSGEDGRDIKKYASMLFDLSGKVQPVVVAGGGKIARHYISIARSFGLDEASLDIIGIQVSQLNAKMLIAALGGRAHPAVPEDLEQVTDAAASGKIIVAGGLHPGQSTNATSALIAEKVGAVRFINATDVNGIYDSDPRTNRKAKLFREITTKQCREILGGESSMAGGYDLMDIVALKVIERSKIPTVVLKSEPSIIKDAVLKNKATGTRITA